MARMTKFEADLRRAFPDAPETSMRLALALMRKGSTLDPCEYSAAARELANSPYGRHRRHTLVLAALDTLLGTHGVEPLGEIHPFDGPPFKYLNTGESYAPTVVWYRSSGRYYVRCYGNLVEAYRIK